jgi:hypothetical protein
VQALLEAATVPVEEREHPVLVPAHRRGVLRRGVDDRDEAQPRRRRVDGRVVGRGADRRHGGESARRNGRAAPE